MATEKQVQSMAKKLVNLIGKMDEQVETRELLNTQEASNQAFLEESVKKNK